MKIKSLYLPYEHKDRSNEFIKSVYDIKKIISRGGRTIMYEDNWMVCRHPIPPTSTPSYPQAVPFYADHLHTHHAIIH